MSRIRSIHPALFTDPEFVQVSMTARMLLIGLWTECDDHGVFEWKPLALKMKLFPADAVDMDALLTELVSAGRIRQVDQEGKPYGICRNFAKYQRPKNPAYKYPFNPAWGNFLGIKSEDSGTPTPALPQPSPSATEKSPQMEDGEEEVEKKKEVERALPRSKRGSRIPEGWEPSPAGIEFARKAGQDPVSTLAAFRDHWTAATGQTATKLDWDAAWRTWCRKAQDFARNKPSSLQAPRGAYSAPAADDEMRRLTGYAQMIKKRVPPGQNFTSADRFKMIRYGMVTMEDCEQAGCAA